MTLDEIGYALSKQVPDMARGVTVHTNYGELTLCGRDAERVAALVRRLLEARLRQAERMAIGDGG
jgi:hypothetical protein